MAVNPLVAQKKLAYAALAHQVIRARMAEGTTITYKELHDAIDSPWRWHGNEFAEVLGLIAVIDREAVMNVVEKATGKPSLKQYAWNQAVDSFSDQVQDLSELLIDVRLADAPTL